MENLLTRKPTQFVHQQMNINHSIKSKRIRFASNLEIFKNISNTEMNFFYKTNNFKEVLLIEELDKKNMSNSLSGKIKFI